MLGLGTNEQGCVCMSVCVCMWMNVDLQGMVFGISTLVNEDQRKVPIGVPYVDR